MSTVLIGTSGWNYDSWRGPFYPQGVAKKEWLAYYAGRFPTVEINGSFYRTPSLAAVHAWRDKTPERFLFAWKASKFITHWKRLGESSRSSLKLMETRLAALGPKAGPVLFQLPPQFHADRARLAAFVKLLSRRRRYAFEFRHASWYADEIFDLLRDNDIALCISDHYEAPAPWIATARHVYVRGHGPGGDYKDSYSDAMLRKWAREIQKWKRQRRDVFVYFDNDWEGAAPHDAARLAKMVTGKG